MSNISPTKVNEKLAQEKDSVCFIDVRSLDEFKSGHVPGANCVPLDSIESDLAKIPKNKLVILSCQSGKRSARAREILQAKGYDNLVEMEGGFSAWAALGLPVNKSRNAIPIFRQVILTAGSLVLAGMALGLLLSPKFFAIPIFIGAGLVFAGATGWCGLAFLLERMPWNRDA